MAIIEDLNIDKYKTLFSNRAKVTNLMINYPKRYLDEELFKE